MAEKLRFDLTLYPAPVLRQVAEPVLAFDEALREIAAGMLEAMYEEKGVGLAAPQVGLRKRILVLNPSGEKADELALVNVEIVDRSGLEVRFEEGCLSFPGIYADVARPERCRVRARDVAGNPIEREFDGFASRIVQHEYDHLEGILLVDRMSPADKVRHRAALEALVDRHRRAQAAAKKPRT
jgi:peptide deformylase